MACCPHEALSVPIPVVPSKRPTSFPQAYPALKLMAEKISTTPADIIHVINVGETVVSSALNPGLVAARLFFAFLSLLGSWALRFAAAACLGDDGALADDIDMGGRGLRAG